ncbi:MAG TPA: hypothetical protein EYQ00_00385, partial [Dehalococcoidia bacterium]|nr:hypothetical protein [Dehalococcoidia bacterium]
MSTISSLPTDPAGGGSLSGNVQLSAVEQNNVISNMQASVNTQMGGGQSNTQQPVELSQATIAELVSGIQKMSNSGNTSLPTRDIPMSEAGVAVDETVKPNYVPPSNNTDYINDYISNESILRDHEKSETTTKNVEDLYDELQTPVLAAMLYFISQMPATKKYETRFIPGLFNTDGNM